MTAREPPDSGPPDDPPHDGADLTDLERQLADLERQLAAFECQLADKPSTPHQISRSDVPGPPRSRVARVPETEAIAAVRAGHREHAIRILLQAYGKPITAFASRIVGNLELACDIRQQVFLEAFQSLHRFEGRSSLWSWLCGITYHRCLDELRRRARTRAGHALGVLDGLVKQPDPDKEGE
jgi:hypothetical protein